MSEQAPAQEQSAPPAEPPASPSAPPQSTADALIDQIATARMTGQSPEALDALQGQLVTALAPKDATPPVVEPKEQPNPEPVPDPTPDPEPVGDPAPEPEAAPEPADRIRLGKEYSEADKTLLNAAHMLLKGGHVKNLTEAIARVSGQTPQHEAPPEYVAPAIPAEITALETQAASIRVKLKEAGASEGLFNEAIADLTIQLSETSAELAQARADHRANSTVKGEISEAMFEQKRGEVLTATVREYPQMTDKTSKLFKTARDFASAASDKEHEDYNIACSMEAPHYFAEKAAKLLGIKPSTAAPSAPQPKAPAPPTPPVAKPAPGSRGSVVQPQATAQDGINAANNNLAAVLAGMGAQPKTSSRPKAIFL